MSDYFNDRWKLHKSGEKIVMTPDAEAMSKWVKKNSEEITRRIMAKEDELTLRNVGDVALIKLIELCEDELKRRESN